MSSSLALLCLRVLVMDARVCDACIGVSVSTLTLQMAGVSKPKATLCLYSLGHVSQQWAGASASLPINDR